MCAGNSSNPNGTATRVMIAAWITKGVSSLSARPTSSAGRESGVARIRSNAPVISSYCRLDPTIDVPNIVIITTTPGRNHCSEEVPRSPSPAIPDSSGPKRARKISGWSSEKIRENGSRQIVRLSRTHTARVSASIVAITHPPLRAGCGR